MRERAVVFGSRASLVGVLTSAEAPAGSAPTGVVFLNAGTVHHVGPHRLYVCAARALAAQGFACLRFDHAGIGESPAAVDERPFQERFVGEAREALDLLAAEYGCQRFAIVGLCSGTLTAFLTALADPRVTDLVLLTALLQDPATVPDAFVAEAMNRRVARSYATEKARDGAAWRRVLTGRANYRHVLATGVQMVARQVRPAPVDPDVSRIIADLGHLLDRGVAISFVFPEPTTVLEAFRMTIEPAWDALARRGRLQLTILPRSDHTFTRLRDQRSVVDLIGQRLRGAGDRPRSDAR